MWGRVSDARLGADLPRVASVDSGSQARDDHLRSADFFDVAQHGGPLVSTDIRIEIEAEAVFQSAAPPA